MQRMYSRTLAALQSAELSGTGPAGKPALSIAIEHGHERVISYLTGCKAVRLWPQPRRSTACEEPLTHSAAQLCDRTGRRAVCSGTAVRRPPVLRAIQCAIRGGATTDCSVCVRSLKALGV